MTTNPARGRLSPPTLFTPQLARIASAPPSGPGWLHELKYDGYRIGCRIDAGEVELLSRNGHDWTQRFAPIAVAAKHLKVRNALLDGEIAVVLPDGRTSFQALQNALNSGDGRLTYFVFDLLHLDGADLRHLPLAERKARLARLMRNASPSLHYADHVTGDGTHMLAEACRHGAEGIVSKRADRPYEAGRGPNWLKVKCIARQEFVIAGFTDPRGARSGIGALLVATYDAQGSLRFAGKVGTGFTEQSAAALRRRLDALLRKTTPLSALPPGPLGRQAHWVEPKLVAEVAFGEWTADGKVRHASFQGLREDKDPRQVRREGPVEPPPSERPARVAPATRSPRTGRQASDPSQRRGVEVTLAGVTLSHADRVLWPDLGVTKLALARYCEAVAEWMLPHIAGRPLTLVRCPDGIAGGCFFMKHSRVWSPAGLRRVDIPEKHKTGQYLIADSAAALVALVQMNVIEVHTWNSTTDDLERPDRLILDLDPGPEVGWPEVVTAARAVRTALDARGLPSFVKTTGGRGLHVVVPLRPDADWQTCLAFAHRLADGLAAADPARFTTNFTKRGRERKILVDYLRNNRTNTSVAAYSPRARPGAAVSMPLTWSELRPDTGPERHTLGTALQRLRRLRADPWAGYAA